jgi:hypothetical protein
MIIESDMTGLEINTTLTILTGLVSRNQNLKKNIGLYVINAVYK